MNFLNFEFGLFSVIILALLLIFVISQLISMFQSRIPKREKGLWFIAFIAFSVLTSIVWLIAGSKK